MGSLKFCSVNAAECRNPWSALAIHFARPACGRWHSTQVATWRWPLLSHPSYCWFMTWQFTHARGSVERYEKPLAYTNVNAPTPAGMPSRPTRRITRLARGMTPFSGVARSASLPTRRHHRDDDGPPGGQENIADGV